MQEEQSELKLDRSFYGYCLPDLEVLHHVLHGLELGAELQPLPSQSLQLQPHFADVQLKHGLQVILHHFLAFQETPFGLQNFVLLLQERT